MHRRLERAALTGGTALLLALGMSPASAAAETVTFTPPAGARVDYTYDGRPGWYRTGDAQPTTGIAVDGGAKVRCSLSNIETSQRFGPCGPALPGCSAAICASYTPPTPLKDYNDTRSEYSLDVEVLDSSDNELAADGISITYDGIPPKTRAWVDDVNPLRPSFGASVLDNEYGDPGPIDSIACSFGLASATPQWHVCMPPRDPANNEAKLVRKLPRRHRAYRFLARGTDEWGRSTTAKPVDYDPLPCSLHASQPSNLASLAKKGIRVKMNCDSIGTAAVAAWAYGRGETPEQAIVDNYALGHRTLKLHHGALRFRGRLPLYSSAARYVREQHSLGIVVAAGKARNLDPHGGYPDKTVSLETFKVTR